MAHISSSDLNTLSSIHNMLLAFKSFDSNDDGLVTVDELKAIMVSLSIDAGDPKAVEMMMWGDSNGDDLMSVAEFLSLMAGELELGDIGKILKTVLPAIAGENEVRAEELYEVMMTCMGRSGGAVLSFDDCMDIVASMDEDGDGSVSIDDLKLVVQALSQSSG